MAWKVIAKSESVEGLRSVSPAVGKLEKGAGIKIRFDLPRWMPVGKLADLAGAEWWAEKLAPSGMIVEDVYGDWTWMEIKGRADPIWLAALIPLIIKAVATLGIAGLLTWVGVTISGDVREEAKIVKEREEVEQKREEARLKSLKELVEKGVPPEEAGKIVSGAKVERPPKKEPLAEIGDIVKWGAIGLIVVSIVGAMPKGRPAPPKPALPKPKAQS